MVSHIWGISLVILTFVTICPVTAVVKYFICKSIVGRVVVFSLASEVSTTVIVTIALIQLEFWKAFPAVLYLDKLFFYWLVGNEVFSSSETSVLEISSMCKSSPICCCMFALAIVVSVDRLDSRVLLVNPFGSITILQNVSLNVPGFAFLFVSVWCITLSLLSVMCTSIEEPVFLVEIQIGQQYWKPLFLKWRLLIPG